MTQSNKSMLRRGLAPCFGLLLSFSAATGFAEVPADLSDNNNNAESNVDTSLTSSPTAQVIVQSISGGGSSYRMTPNAPSMPSFAGGPCIGTSVSASGAIPGVSFGGGVSKEDEACQRRNWVQTLIGAAQHMSPEDSLFMKRLAFEVMRDDEYLSPAFSRLGVAPTTPSVEKNFWGQPKRAKAAAGGRDTPVSRASTANATPAPQPIARAAKSCVTVLAASAPAQMKDILSRQGCDVVIR